MKTLQTVVDLFSIMASGVIVTLLLLLCWWMCLGVVCAGHDLHASWTHIDHLRESETKIVSQMKAIIDSLNDLSVVMQG